jgi:SAM-dependent methyltransferase
MTTAQGAEKVVWRNAGHCVLCGGDTEFIARHEWFRDFYLCSRCGTCPRQRAMVHFLNQLRPNWRQMTIHESSPCIDYYAHQCPGYSVSFYDEKTPLGAKTSAGAPMSRHFADARCENLEKMTFKDGTFDIFLTQDVMEHVFRPDLVFAEVMRVLKPGGLYLFTAPKHKTILNSYPRALIENGNVVHLRPPMYHGNPIGDGSLVTWDYGTDFDDLIMQWSGYLVSTHIIRDRNLGIDGEFLEVFAILKDEGDVIRGR